MKEVKLKNKIFIFLVSLFLSCLIFLSVSSSDGKKGLSFSGNSDGVYVIEDLNIDYRYDKNKYEAVPFVIEPYVVITGDKKLINLLKWSGKPEFFIDLNGKLPGNYREPVQFTGINKKLNVEFYPGVIDLRLMEQQTLKVVPVIELIGESKLDSNLIVSLPNLLQETVMVRDIQDRLNQLGQIKGVIDVSNMTSSEEFEVKLKVYDREGKVMDNINLLDETIKVKVNIDKKITIIKEDIINEIVIVEEVIKDETEKPEIVPQKDSTSNPVVTPPKKEPTKVEKPETVEKPEKPEKLGVLSFVNIPKDYDFIRLDKISVWGSDISIDLKGFVAGKYEMTVKDKGENKLVKFELVLKEGLEQSDNNLPDDTLSGTEEDPESGK